MKKIIALILVLSLSLFCFIGCGKKKKNEDPTPDPPTTQTPAPQTPTEKTYTLSLAVDGGLGEVGTNANKVTNIALALITDADGKIVAARFDSVEPTFTLNADKNDIVAVSRFDTKVEKGDGYTGMPSGSWQNQAKAFENFLIGKTAADVAALDTSNVGPDNPIVAGCTMSSSTPVFQALVAKAFAYTRKVTFKTSETVTLGFAIDAKVSGNVASGAKINAEYAAVALAGGKVVAAMIDSAEATYSIEIKEVSGKGGAVSLKAVASLTEYLGTKNERGDAYDSFSPMPSGRWYQQAQAYANTAVGKTVADLANLSTDPIQGSCSIYTGGYKTVIVRAASYAR